MGFRRDGEHGSDYNWREANLHALALPPLPLSPPPSSLYLLAIHASCLHAASPCPSPPTFPPNPADAAYREVGLNLAVAAMRRGEVARVWAGPRYGYGDQGSFSFPTVPPRAELV